MASYFLHVKTFARGRGGRVTRAAAYRAGERIRDERTSDVYNYTDRQDVAHKEIVLPSEFDGNQDMDWARDRATLWNAAEHAGKRRNSLLAREVLVLLPAELTPAQRVSLVRGFSQDLANRYRSAVDFVIHQPRPGSDSRHHHAHMLMTVREVGVNGMGARTALELSGTERHARGLGPSKADYLALRERWARVTNEALIAAGVAARVDHRSLKDQGINREPSAAIPQKVYYAERRSGRSTDAGDDIRARHRERVEARSKGDDEHARVVAQQRMERSRRPPDAVHGQGHSTRTPRSMLTREELNERRRERHRANAQVLNEKRRERYRQNAEAERQKYREWRRTNAPEVNERRRVWRAANADRVNQRARDYRQRNAERDSAKRWLKMQEQNTHAEQTSRELAGQQAESLLQAARPDVDEALEDARRWLAQSQSQGPLEPGSASAEPFLQRDAPQPGSDDEDEDEDSGKRNRVRDYDSGLE